MTEIAFGSDTALVVVDVQNDFADPQGSLYVSGAEDVVPLVNGYLRSARAAGSTIVVTQDWHPAETAHFITGGGVWPVHCVRGTWGAELRPDLDGDADLVLRKGTGGEDGYSAFTVRDPVTDVETPTGLAAYLQARGVRHVVVVGIAADVCVKATAADARAAGFETTVPWAATRPVELEPGDGERAAAELRDLGVDIVA